MDLPTFRTPENYCTLYLVRHGQTEWNIADRIQGQLDSNLTEEGINGTNELGERLATIQFDAAYSSDLLRAHRTAEILLVNKNLQITTAKALRERTFGKYDGYLGTEYQAAIRELLEQYATLTDQEKWRFKFDEKYESDEELVSRFITLLREIAVAYIGKTVLVVTHGGNLRTFLTHLGYAPFGELKPGTFKNAGYVKVSCDGSDFFVDEVEGVDKTAGIEASTL
jgi:broad specificity phosphatase PhoE